VAILAGSANGRKSRSPNFGDTPMKASRQKENLVNRRCLLAGATAAPAWLALERAQAQEHSSPTAAVGPRERLKITKLETLLVKPRWLLLKVHTDAGIVGPGEPVNEGRAQTVATAVNEIEPYLLGKDPRQVVHHWQAIDRHAF
jgi:galactonate dehydratase